MEARNMVMVAEMQLRSAIARKESRMRGIREDYPYRDNINWLKWVGVKRENGEMKVVTQDLPLDRYPVKPPRVKELEHAWERAKDLGIITIEEGKVVWV